MERRALVAKALLAGTQGTEVLGGLGDYIVIQLEDDPGRGTCSSFSGGKRSCRFERWDTVVDCDVEVNLGSRGATSYRS